MAEIPVPETAPAFDRLFLDRLDRIWVEDFDPDHGPQSVWRIFGSDGSFAAMARLPRSFEPTDAGTDCAITLSRDEHLENGSVLLLEADRAIVVRMRETEWLNLEPKDMASAIELGYFVGNLHWRVKFDGPILKVALDGAKQSYMDRLVAHLENGRATVLEDG